MVFGLSNDGAPPDLVSLSTFDVPNFVQWLSNNPSRRRAITQLDIRNNVDDYLMDPAAALSRCTLHQIFGLLPRLRSLHLSGLVLVRCDHTDHNDWSDGDSTDSDDHFLTHPSLQLRQLTLDRVATVFPFDIDPLDLVQSASRLDTLTVRSCHALLTSPHTNPALVTRCHPHFDMAPVAPFPPNFHTLCVVFPTVAEHTQYRMTRGWYDFTRRLPQDRGTLRLTLRNVSNDFVATVADLIDDDALTVEIIRLEFGARFQHSSDEVWNAVQWSYCLNLKRVDLSIPVERIQNSVGTPRAFASAYNIVTRIPTWVLMLVLELHSAESDRDVVMDILRAVPWGPLDDHLSDHIPVAHLRILLTGTWSWSAEEAIRSILYRGMPRTLVRGVLTVNLEELVVDTDV